MAERSVNQFPSLINQQFKSSEALFERLTQADALVSIALMDGFLDHERSMIHAYLWVLSDLISEAKDFSEQSLNVLLADPNLCAQISEGSHEPRAT